MRSAPLLGHDRHQVDTAGGKGLGGDHGPAHESVAGRAPGVNRRSPRAAGSHRCVDVSRSGAIGAVVAAAALPVAYLWGFTVDDALVSARMAHHLAVGVGYRFNVGGEIVDAVTPLGFAHLLAPFALGGIWQGWQAARVMGVAAWLGAAAWLGCRLHQVRGGASTWFGLLPLIFCSPVAAWASAGMETGIVTALATVALGPGWALGAAGLAAAWRPELIPWAIVLGVGRAWAERRWPRALPQALLLTLGPALVVAAVRQVCFGSPAPLAVLAKPSDLAHGGRYAAAAMIWTGMPALLAAPFVWRKAERWVRVGVAACLAHAGALVLAGGDWMALFRLAVPILPGMVLLGAHLNRGAAIWASAARALLATLPGVVLMFSVGPTARHVASHRRQLVADAAPLLRGAHRVAALDVGWVGVATGASLVDLAGITDPSIAVLPGGHTSKRVSPDLLRVRDVDHVVLLLAPDAPVPQQWAPAAFARAVEARVGREAFARGFAVEGTVDLGGTSQRYLVVGLSRGE